MSKQPDWAKQKLLHEYCIEDGEDGYRACSIPLASVAKLLRAERARAVKVCRREKVSGETGNEGDIGYNQACDDCAAAIGKP